MPDAPYPAPAASALWALGFRPFFLLAGVFAAASVLWWVVQLAGWAGGHVYIAGPLWHAHEMIFGYAFAVIVGFLFTAVRNWTNEPTPSGRALVFVALLWLAGRVLVLVPWPALAALADTSFALAAAAGIGVPLFRSGNRRNYFFVALIVALGAANLCFYLALGGVIHVAMEPGLQFGLDLILFVMAVVAGRVIPMFTANAVPGAKPRRLRWLERVALGSVLALLVIDLTGPPAPAIALVAGIAALAHVARLHLWQPWTTLRRPILWILHASYAWIVIYLALRALAVLDLMAAGPAMHALTVGAIGGLTLGMMTRVSRGHTGRPLEAGTLEVLAYWLVQLAAIVRVFLPLAAPRWYLPAVAASGALWVAAFALFTVGFAPILASPRVDGRSG